MNAAMQPTIRIVSVHCTFGVWSPNQRGGERINNRGPNGKKGEQVVFPLEEKRPGFLKTFHLAVVGAGAPPKKQKAPQPPQLLLHLKNNIAAAADKTRFCSS